MTEKGPIKVLTDDTFGAEIAKGVTLVDFHAEWCGPCRMMIPALEKVAKEVKHKAQIGKLNIDNAQKVASQCQVTSIPTLILYKEGKEVGRLVGLRDAATIKQFVESV